MHDNIVAQFDCCCQLRGKQLAISERASNEESVSAWPHCLGIMLVPAVSDCNSSQSRICMHMAPATQ